MHANRQSRGIGTALVIRAIDRANAAGENAICLYGELSYYNRFGFVPGRLLGIGPGGALRDPDAFLVRTLRGYTSSLDGRYRAGYDRDGPL